MKRFVQVRIEQDTTQTISRLFLFDNGGVGAFYLLEPGWLGNQRNVSCIPAGRYRMTLYKSPTKGLVLLYHDVPDRDYVEMHIGNFRDDTTGCSLPGLDLEDIDHDGLKDVVHSRLSMRAILSHVQPGEDVWIDIVAGPLELGVIE